MKEDDITTITIITTNEKYNSSSIFETEDGQEVSTIQELTTR